MKQLLTLTLLVALSKSYSQNPKGYLFYNNNDSVNANIKIPKGLFGINLDKLYRNVTIEDSTGALIEFTPTEIKGFGFTFKSQEYRFYAKPIDDKKFRFLEPVIVGAKTSLYQYIVGGTQNFSNQDFYTFEKSDSTYLFMTNFAALDKFKEKLKTFYTGNLDVQKLIDRKFTARRRIQDDIKEIVNAVNQL